MPRSVVCVVDADPWFNELMNRYSHLVLLWLAFGIVLIQSGCERGRETPTPAKVERQVGPAFPIAIPRTLTEEERESLATPVTVAHWRMSDVAEERGLRFFGRTIRELDSPRILLYETLGCGGGTIDFDRDGLPDLYLAAAGGSPPEQDSEPNALFRNLGSTFSQVALAAGVSDRGFGQGIAVGDVNEDGFADLLVLNYGPNRLFLNQGDGTFVDARSRMPSERYDEWSSSGAIADIDCDGLSDLFIVNYCAGLGPVIQSCDARATCSPMVFPALVDRFAKGTADGSLREAGAIGLARCIPGRGLGLIVGDLDSRGGNEVFVANDMTPNHLFAFEPSERGRQLIESALPRGLGLSGDGYPQGSMGIVADDFDGDDDIDFYVTNFDGEENTLHVQTESGVWRDETKSLGLGLSTLPLVGFGTESIDVDNSGRRAVFIANGHVDLVSRDGQPVTFAQQLRAFRAAADQGFEWVQVSTIGDYLAKPHVGRSLWTIDANTDGRVDLVATHQTEPVALLINQTESEHAWLRIELVGTSSSRDAIGASVTLIDGAGNRHKGFRMAGGGYQCSNDPILHLGLGQAKTGRLQAIVNWPSGVTEEFGELATRRTVVLVEGLGNRLED
ncbi:MAG: CRTAC1 family protein [Planctomycetota bacterium]